MKYNPVMNLLGLIVLAPFAVLIVVVAVATHNNGGNTLGAVLLLGIVWLFFGALLVLQRVNVRNKP